MNQGLENIKLSASMAQRPLIIAAQATVEEAVTLMSAGCSSCSLTCELDWDGDALNQSPLSSCVLVFEHQSLVGILTERDVVRLIASGTDWEHLPITQVMTTPVKTLAVTELADIFIPVGFFQTHKVRHAPVVDVSGQVVGILTHEHLQRLLRPVDLLRLRLTHEVMCTDVIHATPDQTVAEVVQKMAQYRVSTVVIVKDVDETQPLPSAATEMTSAQVSSPLLPVGLITERDIVQFLALGLDLTEVSVQSVMSCPIFSVPPEASLWVVRGLMQQRRIGRVLVTNSDGYLLGILTQSNLLSVLNPLEIYKLVVSLEEQVTRLELDQQSSVQNQTAQLEQELCTRLADLRTQTQRDRLITNITHQIRKSLSLPDILLTAVSEIRLVLNCDRVLIYRLQDSMSGHIEIESVRTPQISLRHRKIYDSCFLSLPGHQVWQNRQVNVINDVYTSTNHPCYINFLVDLQVRANIAIPITLDDQLWGLLVVQECYQPRQWQSVEIELLKQISAQLAIALHQATAYEQLQNELVERKRAESALSQLNQELELRVEHRTGELRHNEYLLREANERLELINHELSRATRLKDEFLANMSHELRTPLNAILGMSEVLQSELVGSLNHRQQHFVSTIERSGQHLLDLINDILDIAKIESGKLELEQSVVSLQQLCESSLLFVKQQAFQKKIKLDLELPADSVVIDVDERRMRQVLINLLNNAVKFTPESGSVSLKVQVEQNASASALLPPSVLPHQIYIIFSVIDTGIGISEEDLPKLFKPFVQIDSNLNRQYSGTGLGLMLVKQIVEMHGGTVTVSSQVDFGSCFRVYLPYSDLPLDASIKVLDALVDATESSVDTDQSYSDLSLEEENSPIYKPLILLAEDNYDNVETIKEYLETYGYRILLASNGLEATELAVSEKPDLILMDVQMPIMDGLTATRKIRLINSSLSRVPIIMLTALAMSDDRDRCIEAGATDYLSKPIRIKKLVSTIQNYL